MKSLVILSVLILLQSLTVLCQQSVNCLTGEISRNGEYCLVTNIQTDGRILPQAADRFKVKEFEIQNSTVRHLYPDICQQFPNIEKFTASEVGLETLDRDTFKNCRNLKEIRILRNNIRSFDKDLFNRNTNLELLYFGINQLTSIPKELFKNLNKLQDLGFASMNFNKFPQQVFSDLSSLKTLWVYHDALLDLDIEDILRAMPRLEKIYLRDNDFRCSRLRQILNELKKRNVDIDKTIWEGNERKRNYQVSYVEGVECIEDSIYETAVGADRLREETANRFDEFSSMAQGGVDEKILVLKDALEYKIAELKTAHKAEMDDLKRQLSVMHQNLDSKMSQLIESCNKKHSWGGHGEGSHGYTNRNYNKGSA